jgi:chromosome segregation ATPase
MTRIRTSYRFMLAAGLLSGLAGLATADSLQAFQAADAAGDQGCVTIPYSSLRSRCEYKQSNVNDNCKVEKRSCRDLTVKKIQDNIDGMTGKVEKLNREKETLKSERDSNKSKLSSAKDDSEKRDLENKIKDAENRIYELEKQVSELSNRMDQMKKDIENNKYTARERISIGEKCRDHRIEVQGVFADARSKAQGESDPQIKPIAARLVSRWDNSTRSHEQEIRNVIDVIDDCKKTLRGDQ